MKILYVVKNMRISNGVASYIMNYYRRIIKKKNVSIDFLIVSDVGSPYYDEIHKHGSNIYIMPSFKEPIRMFKFLNKIFKDNHYDILHSNVFNSNFLIAYIAKKNGVPVRILHSHATKNGDNLLKIIRNKPFQFMSIYFSNYLFACSEMAGKQIYKTKKFYVINNAIDLEKFKFSNDLRNEIRGENKIEKDELIISTVGRLTIQKNPYFILEIISILSKQNIKFQFWWFGNGDLDNKIKNKANEMELNDYIKFFGSIDDVYKYYNAMDIFILPSLYEGLPIVGIEAQANGLRCIFSDNITDETKLYEKTLFLPIESAEVWCNTIIRCINDCNHNIDDYTLLHEKYDISKLSDSLYKKYVELLKEKDN